VTNVCARQVLPKLMTLEEKHKLDVGLCFIDERQLTTDSFYPALATRTHLRFPNKICLLKICFSPIAFKLIRKSLRSLLSSASTAKFAAYVLTFSVCSTRNSSGDKIANVYLFYNETIYLAYHFYNDIISHRYILQKFKIPKRTHFV